MAYIGFFGSMNMFSSLSSSLFFYSSFYTYWVFLRNVCHELLPTRLKSFIDSKLSVFFSFKSSFKSSKLFTTLIIDNEWDGKLMDASTLFLSSKINSTIKVVRIGKFKGQKQVTTALAVGEKLVDVFQGIDISWQFFKKERDDKSKADKDYYQITFEDQHRDKIFTDYVAHVIQTATDLAKGEETSKLFTFSGCHWEFVDFRHPATFDSVAMDYEIKRNMIDDLERFLSRKEFYKRIGKPWKRSYLLYGPSGTGKSSLIGAMANYLKFNMYALVLGSFNCAADLRKAMLDIGRRSIIVIEDIDCNSSMQNQSQEESAKDNSKLDLSALLKCIDGLWSSGGDERIIVFTTKDKEVLDPSLLLPGRMDMQIHMSYCTVEGFRVLASNYLGIEEHNLFEEIDELLKYVEVTPASLAEELLRSDDADISLAMVVKFLNQKKLEKEKTSSLCIDESVEKPS